MKRLFTFGCSFTQYWRWPTWADCLGHQHEHYENWGLCGAGNAYIFYSLIECNRRYGLGRNDIICIMWTNTSREDRYVNGRWLEGGNIYWDGHPMGRDFARQWACERGYLMRDLALITAAADLLRSWQCDWHFMSMVPLDRSNLDNQLGNNPHSAATDDSDVIDLYRTTLDLIKPSVFDLVFRGDWQSRPGIVDVNSNHRRDFHPTPAEHLEYLDGLEIWSISQHTRDWMLDQDSAARAGRLEWTQPNRPQGRL